MEELRGVVELCKKRIELLKELRDVASSGYNISLPEPHLRMLREKLPLMSDIEVDADKAPLAVSEDYFISKAVITQEEEVSFLRFMPLRAPRASSGGSGSHSQQAAMPSALLVAAQRDGTVRLFTPNGDLVLSFSTGHDRPVTHLATSPSHDEYLVITADEGGAIRVHKVVVRQRRPVKAKRKDQRPLNEEKASAFLGVQANVTYQFFREMQVPERDGETLRLTSVVMVSLQGSKYFVAGDDGGQISVFTKNGTLRKVIHTNLTSGQADLELHAHASSLLYVQDGSWGFVDLERSQLRPTECPHFDGRAKTVIFDSQLASRVIVADEAGTIWVFAVKNKQECRVEHRFTLGTTNDVVSLGSMRGFVLALEGGAVSPPALAALNMSHVGKRKQELAAAPSPVVWRRSRAPTRSWTLYKRHQQGDLVAFLSADGREIEIAEIIMQVYTAPVQDSFGNFKLPVAAAAAVLILGYQYMKQKGGKGFDPSVLKSVRPGRGGGGSISKLSAMRSNRGRPRGF